MHLYHTAMLKTSTVSTSLRLLFLFYYTLVFFSTEPFYLNPINILYISHLKVTHVECIRKKILATIQESTQSATIIEHSHVVNKIYVRTKATSFVAWKCEATTEKEHFICCELAFIKF